MEITSAQGEAPRQTGPYGGRARRALSHGWPTRRTKCTTSRPSPADPLVRVNAQVWSAETVDAQELPDVCHVGLHVLTPVKQEGCSSRELGGGSLAHHMEVPRAKHFEPFLDSSGPIRDGVATAPRELDSRPSPDTFPILRKPVPTVHSPPDVLWAQQCLLSL